MTTEQAREHFNAAIARHADPDKRADLEVAREYFCNPEFRAQLADYLWELENAE